MPQGGTGIQEGLIFSEKTGRVQCGGEVFKCGSWKKGGRVCLGYKVNKKIKIKKGSFYDTQTRVLQKLPPRELRIDDF